jgi:hypothetical protein
LRLRSNWSKYLTLINQREEIEYDQIKQNLQSTKALEIVYQIIIFYSIVIYYYCSLNDIYVIIQSTICIEQVFALSDTWNFISQNKEEKIKKFQVTIQLIFNSRAFQIFISVLANLSTNFRFEILIKILQFQRKL